MCNVCIDRSVMWDCMIPHQVVNQEARAAGCLKGADLQQHYRKQGLCSLSSECLMFDGIIIQEGTEQRDGRRAEK